MKRLLTIAVMTLAAKDLAAQGNSIQLCTQGATQRCISIKAPADSSYDPAPVTLWGHSGALLVGMAETDLSLLSGALAAKGSLVSVTAESDASVGSFAAVAGSYVALASSKTGSGTYLPMTFWTSGTERLRIDTAGSLGLNITSPSATMHVYSGSTGYISKFQGALGYLFMYNSTGNQYEFGTNGAGDLSFDTNSLIRMTIAAGGDVGIGILPISGIPLHVAGDVYRQLYLTSSSGPTTKQMRIGYDVSNNTGVVESLLSGSGTYLLLNPSGGNVGIGTTGPIAALHVKDGTDQNLQIGNMNWVASGTVGFNATNDANSLTVPMALNASKFYFVTGDVGIHNNSPTTALDVTGVITASIGFTSPNSASNTVNVPNGGYLFLNGTIGTISNYTIYQGTSPQINAGSLGAAFTITGSTSSNGNIVLLPGAVAANASVHITAARTDEPALIINNIAGTTTANVLEIRNSGGTPVFKVIGSGNAGAPNAVIVSGEVTQSSTTPTYTVGNSTHRWLTGYFQDLNASNALTINGVTTIDSSRNAAFGTVSGSTFTASTGFASTSAASNVLNIPNGGALALNVTVGSVSNYVIYQGTSPQINAGSLGGAFQLTGSTSTNGNIVLLPGAVASNASVHINAARTDQPALILNNISGTTSAKVFEVRDSSSNPVFSLSGNTNSSNPNVLLTGLASTDVAVNSGAIVSGASFVTVTGASNASVGSFGAIAGNYVALSSSKSGSGTYLPLVFFTSASERFRVDTAGHIRVTNGTPSVSGTGCSVSGNDTRGAITGCSTGITMTLTFANAYATNPYCIVTNSLASASATTSTTTLSTSVGGIGSPTLYYHCIE